MAAPVSWAIWPDGVAHGSDLVAVGRIALRALVWGRDPAALFHDGGPVGVALSLAVSLVLALAAWISGSGRPRHRRHRGNVEPSGKNGAP
ncbi:MAG TPA: hypothetical protein VMQ59_01035 [Acidimicrobiales bacterium]|jgi:hypothetical protein|nr:hypothetical protein [Acidimicrobiales bacterium]